MKKYLSGFSLFILLLLSNSCNKADKNGTLKVTLNVPDSLVVDPNHGINVIIWQSMYAIKEQMDGKKNHTTVTVENLYPSSYWASATLVQIDTISHHTIISTIAKVQAEVKAGETSTITLSDWH